MRRLSATAGVLAAVALGLGVTAPAAAAHPRPHGGSVHRMSVHTARSTYQTIRSTALAPRRPAAAKPRPAHRPPSARRGPSHAATPKSTAPAPSAPPKGSGNSGPGPHAVAPGHAKLTPAAVPPAPSTLAAASRPAGLSAAGRASAVAGVGDLLDALDAGPPGIPAAVPPARAVAGAPSASHHRHYLAASPLPRTVIVASGASPAPSLTAATDLGVPIIFGALVGLFLLVQSAIGRRDPRLADAPARGDDDSVAFE